MSLRGPPFTVHVFPKILYLLTQACPYEGRSHFLSLRAFVFSFLLLRAPRSGAWQSTTPKSCHCEPPQEAWQSLFCGSSFSVVWTLGIRDCFVASLLAMTVRECSLHGLSLQAFVFSFLSLRAPRSGAWQSTAPHSFVIARARQGPKQSLFCGSSFSVTWPLGTRDCFVASLLAMTLWGRPPTGNCHCEARFVSRGNLAFWGFWVPEIATSGQKPSLLAMTR